jgi:polyisoprenoid-binding protein YceI
MMEVEMIEKIRGRLVLLAVGATLCITVPFVPALPAAAQTSLNVPAATYTIDPKHTQIVFGVKHMGLSTFFGRFGYATGSLIFDPAAPEKSALSAQIDMNNLTTHWDELDQQLKASVFHIDKFPNATFVATQSVKTGPNTGTVTGNLTIAGVTKPVTLNVTFNGGRNSPIPLQPYRIGFDATGTLRRSDFGLNHAIWSGMVGDEVTLWIECELEKK